MDTGKADFIVIDDNKVDCFIAEKVIENSGKGESCRVFYQATQALEYIKEQHSSPGATIVFVDIQMPVMNGFQFVDYFERLPLPKQHCFYIYALSSSINQGDIERIKAFRSVKGFLNKPLTVEMINNVVKAAFL
ncbi:response regulator receiver domain-containing protein [Anseongella ginsenosidimutans]|uniref:Response regulator receiver domain-containing protein n=1 Tax=Anseongella ginsenosidimutans TaxID=496056 RepID=A0A4R3KRT3_9SPHI|nr:response regulator [Anseongella ginsenosidimutans]QEC53956.1 response regulator [Anseongella ginsenosidimutans]TCS86343.1 response regulator receiver domain-containing protein [Anseongella ginsenosidimutans]